ncbi:PQQ-binding-like beta-propeller repeat protein [Georgenia alba]|uniref:PQQ-binding-like beta-propeller repeat protein n=1 Tax=Georgenia alba TaxID=2233858 RepID=A0ABW2QDC2_9MICO
MLCSLLAGLGSGAAVLGLVAWLAGRAPDGVPADVRWTIPTVLVALLASLVAPGALDSRGLRVVGGVLVGVLGVAAVVAWTQRPAPPETEDPMSNALPLGGMAPALLAAGAVLVAATTVLAARSTDDRSPPVRLGWRRALPAAVAVGVVAAAGTLLPAYADDRVHRHNTRVSAPVPAQDLASTLTGDVAWQSQPYGGSHDAGRAWMAATSGGLALGAAAPGGIRMLDPGSGEWRWEWRRSDLAHSSNPLAVSAEGGLLAALFTAAGDRHPAPPRVVVLGADSGDVRAELFGPVGTPLAVTEQMVVTVRPGSEESELIAHDLDGSGLWTTMIAGEVETGHDLFFGDDGETLLTTVRSGNGDGWRSVAVDLASGDVLWDRNGSPPLQVVPGTGVAVTGDVAQSSQLGEVLAVDLRDGEPIWEQDVTVPDGRTRNPDLDGCDPRLDVDAEHLTFLTCTDLGRHNLMTAIDPRTGDILWEQALKSSTAPLVFNAANEDPMQAMPDGTTAVLRALGSGEAESYEILRIGPDGVTRSPLWEGVTAAPAFNEWLRVGGTTMIDLFPAADQWTIIGLR